MMEPPQGWGLPPPQWEGSEPDRPTENAVEVEDADELSSVSSVSEVSDREVEVQLELMRLNGVPIPGGRRDSGRPGDRRRRGGFGRGNNAGPGGPNPYVQAMRHDDMEAERDPWNAVAVVGLRVYYKIAEGDDGEKDAVELRVVRPTSFVDDDDETDSDEEQEGGRWPWKKKNKAKAKVKIPDVDDSSRDAVLVAANLEQAVEVEGKGKEEQGDPAEENDVVMATKDQA
jgi:hypothetical protein